MRSDNGANKNLYGRQLTARQIIQDGAVRTPAAGAALVGLLQKKSPRDKSDNPK